jgi:uncharacterized protein YjiS (DUF1127 family)
MRMHFVQEKTLGARESARERIPRPQYISATAAVGWLRMVRFWIGRHRQRRRLGELAELDNYLLKDIGVSQDEALREAAKPFWR